MYNNNAMMDGYYFNTNFRNGYVNGYFIAYYDNFISTASILKNKKKKYIKGYNLGIKLGTYDRNNGKEFNTSVRDDEERHDKTFNDYHYWFNIGYNINKCLFSNLNDDEYNYCLEKNEYLNKMYNRITKSIIKRLKLPIKNGIVDINEEIKKRENQYTFGALDEPLTNYKVVVYTKNGCGYCEKTKEFLSKCKNVDLICKDNSTFNKKNHNSTYIRDTVPKIFINETYIGGWSELENVSTMGGDRCLKLDKIRELKEDS